MSGRLTIPAHGAASPHDLRLDAGRSAGVGRLVDSLRRQQPRHRLRSGPLAERAWPRLRDGLLAWPLPLAVLALWALAAHHAWVAPQVLPSPEAVALTFRDSLLIGELWANLQISLVRVLAGFAVGLVGGSPWGSRWAFRRPSRTTSTRSSRPSRRCRCSAGCRC